MGLSAALLWGVPALAQPPVSFEAGYHATSRGLSAKAERSLRQSADQQFQLTNVLELRVLGARLGRAEETSTFRWEADVPIPVDYVYEQTGLGGRLETVSFDWNTAMAESREDENLWELPLHPGVQDKLSFQALLAAQLVAGDRTEMTVDVVDNEQIETQLYRVIGAEVIETPLGRLNTLRVDRIREPDATRRTSFWLATDWSMLLARLVQVSGNGTETELLLETATVDGQPVTPLP
jgi:hypothetical protein